MVLPLTHTRELFAKALKGKYALGAFNVDNMDLFKPSSRRARRKRRPSCSRFPEGARQYANPVYLKKLIEAAVSLSTIPIAVHLDTADTFELCKDCIDEGFTSVMIDASHEQFQKNIEITKKVVEYARKRSPSWNPNWAISSARSSMKARKAEVFRTAAITTPGGGGEICQESGCDSLAVAIGNSHGAYKFKGEQHLDLERLKAIRKALMDAGLGDYPLVLHGASSMPKELVEEMNESAATGH